MEERYLWAVLSYVERNPVRAGLVSASEAWRWSSARYHLGETVGDGWLNAADWARHWTPESWKNALTDGLDEASLRARLGEATATGRPLGEAGFVEACEERSGLLLRRQKPGPKPKGREENALVADSSLAGQAVGESW